MNDGILVRHLTVKYGKDVAVDDISISLPQKGMIGLSGPSGSGKSTLIKTISGEIPSFKGTVISFGVSLNGLSDESRREYRNANIGVLTQKVDLLESETALSNVMFVLDSRFVGKRRLKLRRAKDLLAFSGCSGFAGSDVNNLSGGQRQKVGLACALANEPRAVLADEPTSALDTESGEMMMNCLRGLSKQRLVIVASHDTDLLARYCDQVYFLNSGQIVSHVSRDCDKQGATLLAPRLFPREGGARPSAAFKFRHAFHVLAKRRWRSFLSLSAMTISMMGIASGTYLFTSIGKEVESVIGSVIPQNQLWIKNKGTSDGQTMAVAASDTDLAVVTDAFPEFFSGSGAALLFDFKSVFADGDDVMITFGDKSVPLPYLSSSSFNDFVCAFEIDEEIFPRHPGEMELDEIILGLPFDDLSALCFNLSLKRDYESFGDAVANAGSLLLTVANRAMGYYDEQLFTIVGVVKTPSPCIVHFDKNFNVKLFIDEMKFKPTVSSDINNPQQVFTLPFLYLKQDYDVVVPSLLRQPFSDFLLFDPASPSYLPSLYAINEFNGLRRLYVFNYENTSIQVSDVEHLASMIDSSTYMMVPPLVWYCDGQSIVSGFAGSFLVSGSYGDLFSAGEALSSQRPGTISASPLLPESVLDGSFLSSTRGGLRLSGYFGGKIRGKVPQKLNEICVSSRIYEDFGQPETVHAAIEVPLLGSAGHSKDIRYFDFSITGVVEDDNTTIYVKDNWLLEFYLLECNISALSLVPNMAIFFVDNTEEAKEAFAEEETKYEIVNPNDLADGSFGGVTDYIFSIVIFFSSLCLLLSLVLYRSLLETTYDELSSERKHTRLIGIVEKEEKSMFRYVCLTNITIALLCGFSSVLFLEFAVHKFVEDSFGGTSSFAISLLPFGSLVLCGLTFYLLSFLPFGNKSGNG